MKRKTVLITGATAGIGRYLALDLATKGHRVIASGRKAALLETLSEDARGKGLAIETLILDVTKQETITEAAAKIGAIDVLINNAGYGQAGPLLELDDRTLREQFDVNVFGLMAVTRAFAPGMIERQSGTIINLSSLAGLFTSPMFGAYHASKYALEALSDALRMELASFGVRVVLVEPGPVTSEFATRAVASLPAPKNTPYATVYARADSIRARTDRFEVGPEKVGAAVQHAITSRRPRARYLVPSLRSEIFLFLLKLAPTRLLDSTFRCVFGLYPKKLRALEVEGAVR